MAKNKYLLNKMNYQQILLYSLVFSYNNLLVNFLHNIVINENLTINIYFKSKIILFNIYELRKIILYHIISYYLYISI